MYSHQNGETALIYTADRGHADNVKLLIEAGADIEAKNNVSKRISICTYVIEFVRMCMGGEGE